jgi:SAM-dependent methyltransferase
MLDNNGLSTRPNMIAELGPGDSLGIGMSAMLGGADKYLALDVVKFANITRNLEIFDQLIGLFKNRERIPDNSEFPRVRPYLGSYNFPSHILTEERLAESLNPKRLELLRRVIYNPREKIGGLEIKYIAPWDTKDNILENSVDMIFSQAALEHVNDLSDTYNILYRYLKPSGIISHDIDFKSHGTSSLWNGHWRYSDIIWRLIRGKRKHSYWLNRYPHSAHIKFLKESGFRVICDIKNITNSQILRKELAPEFNYLTDEDMVTSSAFIQAIKI